MRIHMPREVTTDGDRPYIIDEEELEDQGGNVAICQCGLSADKPFCDGSHRQTEGEEEGVLYRYDEDGEREIVSESD